MQVAVPRLIIGALVCVASAIGWAAETAQSKAEAARLNNLGVAMMNQQLMEKAVSKFDAALRADPTLLPAELNKGIALLNLQKLPEAEHALQDVIKKDPSNAWAWYNLGLVHRSAGDTAKAIEDFQQAAKLAPHDADVYYFLGTFYSQQQDYPKAIENFEHALKLNPLHASAEFGLARALQRSGQPDAARIHLKKFEHLTQSKISSPITLSYGEQGRLSMAQDVITNEPVVGPMIPVKFAPLEIGSGSRHPLQPAQSLVSIG